MGLFQSQLGSHEIAAGLSRISAGFTSRLKWGSCHRAVGIQLRCRKAKWVGWGAGLSPCPQMRCGKRQGKARRCCAAFPSSEKSGKAFAHTASAWDLEQSFPMKTVLIRRGHATVWWNPGRSWPCKQHDSLHSSQLESSSQYLPQQQTKQSALSKEGIHLINSCGAVKLKFNLNVLNTPWHFNHC